MKTNTFALLAVMGILMVGIISGQQFAYAQSDELKVEIKIENEIANVEVESEDGEYEFRLATSDIDEILEVTSLRTGISIELLENAMKLEVKNDSEKDTENNEEQKDERIDSSNIDTSEFERKIRASTLDDSSEIKIELEFSTETVDSDLLIDEIHEKFIVTPEEAEDLLKIQSEDDDKLEEKFDVEIETDDGTTEVEVELRYVLDSVNRDEIIASIVEQSQLDRQRLADAIETEETTEDDSDVSDSFIEDTSDDTTNNSEIETLREENQRLREEINDLREQLANLNQVLMEQIRVIMDTLTSLRT